MAVVVGYAFLSLALAPTMGTSTGVLAVIPVTIGGLLFGTRGGALVGLAAIPSNAVLIDLAGSGNNGVIIGVSDLPGATALVIAGSLIGKLRDLSARVAVQLADRSMAHDEVRRLSRQNYLLLNAVGDGVCGLDLNGNATFVNSAAARLLGWHSDELTGKLFSDSFKTSPIDGRGDYLTIDAITRGLAPGEVSLMLERRDGMSLPVEVVSLPVLDERGVLTGAVVTFRDIGDRVQNRMIVENLTEAISITVGSRRAFANRAFFRMFDAPDVTPAQDLPLDGMIAEEDR